MVSKKKWLNKILDSSQLEVLIYNGNLDVIVHVPGMNRVVNSLKWGNQTEFFDAEQDIFWVRNHDDNRYVRVNGRGFKSRRGIFKFIPPNWLATILFRWTQAF